jgi:hypothetical protein
MKKTLLTLCALFAVLILFSKSTNNNKISNNLNDMKQVEYSNEVFLPSSSVPEDYMLLGNLSAEDISIYGRENGSTGNYSSIAVEFGDKVKFYNWTCINREPDIYLQDLNSDGHKELAIVLKSADDNFLHILDAKTLNEIKFQNYSEVFKKLSPAK